MAEYMDMHTYLNSRRAELNDDFDRQKVTLREIQKYISPYTGIGLTGNYADEQRDGGRKDELILDPTATYAMRILAAGLHGGITSPSRPWFKITLPDQDLAAFAPVKDWLYMVEKRMYFLFAKSRAYQAFYSLFNELGLYGTGAMAMFHSFKSVVRCRQFTIGEYRFGLNNELSADTFLTTQWMSAKQMVQEFGYENVSRKVKQAYDNKKAEQLFEVCWMVEPNDDRFEHKDFMNRPWRSVYWEPDNREGRPLEVSGFGIFPVMVPRWEVSGNRTWGTGVGHTILGHVKELQSMRDRSSVILDKQTDPPLVGPSVLKNGTVVNSMPGGITALDETSNAPGLRPLHNMNINRQDLLLEINDLRQQIRQGAFNDIFMMIANSNDPQKTAYEIAQRKEEKLQMLGPMLESTDTELLNNSIDAMFYYMIDNDPPLIPPPPPEVQGMPLQVEYINILSQAQKMAGISAITQYVTFAGQMMGMGFTEARYKLNSFGTLNNVSEMLGLPPNTVPDDQVAAAQLQSDIAKQQAMQQGQAMLAGAQGAKTLADTPLDSNSALDALLGRTQPQQ